MSSLDAIKSALSMWPSPRLIGETVAVPTHCLYPSNGVIRVYVSGGEDAFASGGIAEFRVNDGGGALGELEACGGRLADDIHIIRNVSRAQGMDVTKDGVIFSPAVPLNQLAGTVVLVANAAKESAHALVDKHRPSSKKSFREALAQVIDLETSRGRFVEVAQRRVVNGASNKQHKFDYEIVLSGKRRILLDAVIRDANSINSVLAANVDVKQAELQGTLQRIVYDDEDNWSASDLSLLGIGATVVPFSKLRPVLDRLAA